jgi:kumamolisin
VTNDGVTYRSARNAPSLPDNVAENVRAIGGLQPHRHMRKHLRRSPSTRKSATPSHSTSALGENGYMVKQILQAYEAEALQFTGAGQVIAIVIDTAPKPSDMSAFWSANGIAVKPTRVNCQDMPSHRESACTRALFLTTSAGRIGRAHRIRQA